MNTTQISPSLESHTEEPLWQEFTEQEQEKICGGNSMPAGIVPFAGRWTGWTSTGSWRDAAQGQARYTRFWVRGFDGRRFPQTQIIRQASIWERGNRISYHWGW